MTGGGPRRPLAVALDLGSTRIKAAVLDDRHGIARIEAEPAPPLRGVDPIREGDAEEYARTAERVLRQAARGRSAGVGLAIASQRSTFLLWNRENGRPLTPMISWQDRRAADWCARHGEIRPEIARITGLPLIGHYAGPKLAVLQSDDPAFRAMLRDPRTRFGTLETWLVWRWADGELHVTDPSMAARTLMFDLDTGEWSPRLLDRFGVPRDLLPEIVPSVREPVELAGGLRLVASLADQACAALARIDPDDPGVLVSLGTGVFVLREAASSAERVRGCLTGPLIGITGHAPRYAVEASVNLGGATDRYGPGPTDLPATDPAPEAFCIPDSAGLGSPHWRPEIGLRFSPAARLLEDADRRRVVLEGLLFRIRESLSALGGATCARRILLAGGLARESFVGSGLAALLGRRVEIADITEAVLVGAARLAAGLAPYAPAATTTIEPGGRGGYLAEKAARWRGWVQSELSAPGAIRS